MDLKNRNMVRVFALNEDSCDHTPFQRNICVYKSLILDLCLCEKKYVSETLFGIRIASLYSFVFKYIF